MRRSGGWAWQLYSWRPLQRLQRSGPRITETGLLPAESRRRTIDAFYFRLLHPVRAPLIKLGPNCKRRPTNACANDQSDFVQTIASDGRIQTLASCNFLTAFLWQVGLSRKGMELPTYAFLILALVLGGLAVSTYLRLSRRSRNQ